MTQGKTAPNRASLALLSVEAVGSLLMWAPIPLAWLWIGGRVFRATGSLGLDLAVAFLGFLATTALAVAMLTRVDRAWVESRRRSGHDQAEGALAEVVVASATFGLLIFLAWFYFLADKAFVIPFMPS